MLIKSQTLEDRFRRRKQIVTKQAHSIISTGPAFSLEVKDER